MLTSVPSLTRRALPKWHGVIRAGILRAIVRLAVKMLVFEKHHRVIATNRGAQQSCHIQRGGWHDHAQPGQWVKIDSPLWLW